MTSTTRPDPQNGSGRHHSPGNESSALLAVVGAHLDGLPLNHQLTERGAKLIERTTTAACYRLYRLHGDATPRPALKRVHTGGKSVEVEVWSIDIPGLGAVTADIPPPLGIGSVQLRDGRWVNGFICEPYGLSSAVDITNYGSWRAYLASDPPAPSSMQDASGSR